MRLVTEVASALIVAEFCAMLRAAVKARRKLKHTARIVNRLLCEDLSEGRFLCACFGILDSKQHRIELVNAGHGMVYWLSDEGNAWQVEAEGLPLGILPESGRLRWCSYTSGEESACC